jgi:hypothetical protein
MFSVAENAQQVPAAAQSHRRLGDTQAKKLAAPATTGSTSHNWQHQQQLAAPAEPWFFTGVTTFGLLRQSHSVTLVAAACGHLTSRDVSSTLPPDLKAVRAAQSNGWGRGHQVQRAKLLLGQISELREGATKSHGSRQKHRTRCLQRRSDVTTT